MNDCNLDRDALGLACGKSKGEVREYDVEKLVQITMAKKNGQPTRCTAIAGKEALFERILRQTLLPSDAWY